MPMPKSARNPKSIAYDEEKPLRNANSENHRIDSIIGSLRPHRSAAVPATTPPTNRITSVTVASNPASPLLTVKLL